jgi:DnaJ-class molecular chaperone
MTPEKDVQGKSEAEIINRINNNYKILQLRAEIIYPDANKREAALQTAKQAVDVLSDPVKREAYLQEHKRILQEIENKKVSVTYFIVDDDETMKKFSESENE